MPEKHGRTSLPDKVGGKVKGRGKVTKIRTINPKPGKFIHVRVMSKAGKRGGRTLAGSVQTAKRFSPGSDNNLASSVFER